MASKSEPKLRRNPSWWTRFFAVVKYELLWNLRRKKFLGVVAVAFVFSTLSLVLPVVLSGVAGKELSLNPDYVVNAGLGGFAMFLFAVATVMNSISGEFESGTIIPLLTKPVSRTTVFLGKVFAAFLTLFCAYAVLFVYIAVGGTLLYGAQNNLHLVPLMFLGSLLSTFVWVAIVLALGALSKSSLMAALGAFGIFLALSISTPMVSLFTGQAWVLHYMPGSGATGYIREAGGASALIPGAAVSTGTDAIAANIVNYALRPSANVSYVSIERVQLPPQFTIVSEEPLQLVLFRSIGVALAYVAVFLGLGWYVFKRAQVLE